MKRACSKNVLRRLPYNKVMCKKPICFNPYLLGVLLIILGTLSCAAQSRSVGGIARVVKVVGNVTVMSSETGTKRFLVKGDRVMQGFVFETVADSYAILLFDNGATVNVKPSTKFSIDTFMHEPFDGSQSDDIASLVEEPNSSETTLTIDYGRLVGKVKKLNYEEGSTYQIETPLGVAGIRGTVYDVYINPKELGEGSFGIAEGRAIFEPTFPIIAGQAIDVKLARNKGFEGTTPVIVTDEISPEIKTGIQKEIEEMLSMVASTSLHLDIAATEMVPGVIKLVGLSGNVAILDKNGSPIRTLSKGDILSEGDTVYTTEDSSGILLFSNGATVLLKADSMLIIKEFQQNPHKIEGVDLSDLDMEPTSSITKLLIEKGEIVGNVKRLNTKENSSYLIETPMGKVRIAGTVFHVVGKSQAQGSVGIVSGKAYFTPIIPVGDGSKLMLDVGENVKDLASFKSLSLDEIARMEFDVSGQEEDIEEPLLDEEGPLPPLPPLPQPEPITPSGGTP